MALQHVNAANRRFVALALVHVATLSLTMWSSDALAAGHRFIAQGNGRLVIVAADGTLEWEMPWGGIHDLHVLPNGHIMVQQRMKQVVEIDPTTKQIVWSYDSASNGNARQRVEIHSFLPWDADSVLVAESGPARLIEVNRHGELLKQIALRVDHPNPHTDTRLVRRTPQGNYLVAHEADGAAREYDSQSGQVVWEYRVPLFGNEPKEGHGPEAFGNRLFCALRLPNGHTLISTGNGHSVIEVTPAGQIAWQLHQDDLPGIRLAWVTTLELLKNGNLVIGNCHAGPGQPLLIEIERRTKRVVWAFDGYDRFGNNVSNSQLLDVQHSIR